MRCSSDVLKKTSPLDVFGDVSEKVKHLTNDASNDVSPPALCPPVIFSAIALPSTGPLLGSAGRGANSYLRFRKVDEANQDFDFS